MKNLSRVKVVSKLFVLSLFLFISKFSVAQELNTVHPFPEYYRYSDGHLTEDGLMLLCDIDSVLSRSEDGGENWSNVYYGDGSYVQQIEKIQLTNGEVNYLLMTYDNIYQSTDEGKTWTKVADEFDKFIKLESFGEGHVAVLLQYSKLIYSNDGGSTWIEKPEISLDYVVDISFDNIEIGWAISRTDIIKTIDGGESWGEPVNYPNEEFVYVEFANEEVGYVIATTKRLFKTIDGGENWELLTSDFLPSYPRNLEVQGEDSIYTNDNSYNNHEFIYSNDGGLNFETFEVSDNGSNSVLEILPEGDGEMWIISSNQTVSRIINGVNEYELFPAIKTDLFFVEFTNDLVGYSGGRGTELLKTVDGGATWNSIFSLPGVKEDLTYNEAGDLFLVNNIDSIGEVWKSIDEGENWVLIFENMGPLFTIYNTPDDRLLLGSTNLENAYYTSIDHGLTWEKHPQTFFGPITIFDFVNKDVGFCTGAGYLYKTIDGGVSWETVWLSLDYGIKAIAFLNENEGLICGFGIIFRTTNGGEDFESVAGNFVRDFEIVNSQKIMAVYGGRSLYVSNDGGLNWDFEDVDTAYPLFDVHLKGNGNEEITIVGGGGIILSGSITTGLRQVNTTHKELPLVPNPGTDYFSIEGEFQNVSFEIYDAVGKLLKRIEKLNVVNPKFDMSEFTAGTYQIRILDENGSRSETWMKLNGN